MMSKGRKYKSRYLTESYHTYQRRKQRQKDAFLSVITASAALMSFAIIIYGLWSFLGLG